MTTKHLSWVMSAVVCALIGFLGYAAISADYAYRQAVLQIRALSRTLVTEGDMRYGKVVSTDLEKHTIRVQFINPFAPSAEPLLDVLAVPPLTLIARQDLQGDGVYSVLSSITPATLADIPIGARIKFYYDGSNGVHTAHVILFGNPL